MKIKNIIIICLTVIFVFGFFAWGIIQPDIEISQTERRKLTTFPEINTETIFSGEFMSNFDSYTLDHFPLRDSFRSLKALTSFYLFQQKDNNDFYCHDGYIIKAEYPMDEKSVDYALGRFQFIYDKFLKDKNIKVYSSLVPDKNYFVNEGNLSIDYKDFADRVKDKMSYAEYIDIFPMLELSDYYATDTHWRQEKITHVAEYLAEKMGTEINGDYEKKEVETPFYGVYHGQAAMPVDADKLYYLTNDVIENCKVKDLESNSYIPMYDMEKLKSKGSAVADPYEMFLSGPNRSILEIENPKATNNKELIVFRDSYANAIVPLLSQGYSKVTLIDIRRATPEFLGYFVKFDKADVLFLQSTLVLNDSSEIK